jgi:predicted DNA-binding transcriptional regulator AlpA
MNLPNREAKQGQLIEPLLTAADLQRALRVTRRAIARWCAAGRLPRPLLVGGVYRWRASDVRRFMESLV